LENGGNNNGGRTNVQKFRITRFNIQLENLWISTFLDTPILFWSWNRNCANVAPKSPAVSQSG